MSMHTVGQRFWTPRMVEKYYDRSILVSPLFWLLTVVYGVTVWDAVHQVHGRNLVEVLVLIGAGWVHMLVQHRWFIPGDDPKVLRRQASKSMLAFTTLFIIAVGVLLRMVK